MSVPTAPPPVVVGRVHAEPADDPVPAGDASTTDVAWLALFEDGTIERFASAGALARAVQRRDRRAAARAARRGQPAMFATVITWNDIPPGFVPPTLTEGD